MCSALWSLQRAFKEGNKGKKRHWEQVDRRSRGTLGTHEAGERKGRGEALQTSWECEEEELGLEMEEDEEPLL